MRQRIPKPGQARNRVIGARTPRIERGLWVAPTPDGAETGGTGANEVEWVAGDDDGVGWRGPHRCDKVVVHAGMRFVHARIFGADDIVDQVGVGRDQVS